MRKKIIILLLLFLCIFLLAFKRETYNSFPLFGKLIILDPGHGGLDPGTVYNNKYEKDYNLNFARHLKKILEKKGATVLMTRDGDYDLGVPNSRYRKRTDFNNRIKLINESKSDIYISLHMNYLMNENYYGPQVFYSNTNKHNKIIALEIKNGFDKYLQTGRNIKEIDKTKYMFDKIDIPGILIEYGFMSNYRDRKNLKTETYQDKLARIITGSIITYFM